MQLKHVRRGLPPPRYSATDSFKMDSKWQVGAPDGFDQPYLWYKVVILPLPAVACSHARWDVTFYSRFGLHHSGSLT